MVYGVVNGSSGMPPYCGSCRGCSNGLPSGATYGSRVRWQHELSTTSSESHVRAVDRSLGASGASSVHAMTSGGGVVFGPIGAPTPMNPSRGILRIDCGDVTVSAGLGAIDLDIRGVSDAVDVPQQLDVRWGVEA